MKLIDIAYEIKKDKIKGTKEYIEDYITYNACPSDFGFKDVEDSECLNVDCIDCWNRESKEVDDK